MIAAILVGGFVCLVCILLILALAPRRKAKPLRIPWPRYDSRDTQAYFNRRISR